jgi:hypothetical protein
VTRKSPATRAALAALRVFLPRLSWARFLTCGVVAIGAAGAGAAEPTPAASGRFTIGESTYHFTDAVAFRTTKLRSFPGENVTVVVLTADPIDRQQVASAVAENGNWTGSGQKVRFILRFDSTGKLQFGMFQADGKNIGLMSLQEVASEVSVADNHARGRVALSKAADFFGEPYVFEASFDAELVAPAA